MMRKPEAVIFDMDGVLIDSEPFHIDIERKIFENLGISVSDQVHRSYLGTAADYMYRDLKSRFVLSQTVEELLEFDETIRCEYFRKIGVLNLNQGVQNLLAEIKLSGLKLAVATSSSPELARILLERCGIYTIFDAVVTTSEAGKSKPAPDVYLLAALKIGVDPAYCLVFEDSPNGLTAAKKAGMYGIAVQTSSVHAAELAGADFFIPTFSGTSLAQIFDQYSDNQLFK